MPTTRGLFYAIYLTFERKVPEFERRTQACGGLATAGFPAMMATEGEEMTFQAWTVVVVGLCYVGLLFAVATWGDRQATSRNRQRRPRPLIYALSLARLLHLLDLFRQRRRVVPHRL